MRGGALQLAKYYLSPKPSDHNCPMTTLAMDAARSPKEGAFRAAYVDGLEHLVELIAGKPSSERRLTLLAAIVGASVLRKATGECALMEEIEAAVLEFGRTVD